MNRTVRTDTPGRRRRGRSPAARTNGAPHPGQPGRSGGRAHLRPADTGDFAMPVTTTPPLPAAARFTDLDLPAPLLAALHAEGVTVPFPIQAATLPDALAGRDVLGRGRTGSGKTLAFGLPLLVRTAGQTAEPRRPLALVLVPTRELAQQVTDALTPYARSLRLRVTTVVGGVSLGRQARALRAGAEVVVATPGRLRDLTDRGDCVLDQVAVTVLDEADRMTDMGFTAQVTHLLDQVRPDGQRMLFSATLDRNIDVLVRRYLSDPVVHSVNPTAGAVTTMEHHVLRVDPTDKQAVVTEIAARDGRVILFVGTKHAADRLAKRLLAVGVRAAALHGGKSQNRRTRALDQFKSGDVPVLVATDVGARGIHVDDLDLVVNVDPPRDHKDYLHRGGRTARAGRSGTVATLVLPEQRRTVDRLTADAGVTARATRVHPGEAALSRITGARTPSGVPVVLTEPAAAPAPNGGRKGTGRARRSSGRPAATTRRAS